MTEKLYKVSFEVFGIVQGVFFRKYTQKRASELGLVGWVKNTPDGTVQGEFQGIKPKTEEIDSKETGENNGIALIGLRLSETLRVAFRKEAGFLPVSDGCRVLGYLDSLKNCAPKNCVISTLIGGIIVDSQKLAIFTSTLILPVDKMIKLFTEAM